MSLKNLSIINFKIIKTKGVTLIELLFVVCIIGVLAAIAFPSYQSQLYKIRRSEGQQSLLLLAAELEDYYSQNNSYMGYALNKYSAEFYDLDIMQLAENHYTISATPKMGMAQEQDPCGTLSITDRQVMMPVACWG